jgi:hypothetical protein
MRDEDYQSTDKAQPEVNGVSQFAFFLCRGLEDAEL